MPFRGTHTSASSHQPRRMDVNDWCHRSRMKYSRIFYLMHVSLACGTSTLDIINSVPGHGSWLAPVAAGPASHRRHLQNRCQQLPTMVSPVAGVWQRQWEEDPIGDSAGADRETLVLWTQSGCSGIYVDIRRPKECLSIVVPPRPSAIAGDGPHSSDTKRILIENLESILRQKSFAGVLKYSEGDTTESGEALKQDAILTELANSEDSAIGLCTCFWRRDIDYQPPSGGLDIGVCASEPPRDTEGSVLLRETGADASYAEGWLRLPKTYEGPFMALALVSENESSASREGYWVRAGNRFAYAIGRSSHGLVGQVSEMVGKNLIEATNSLSKKAEEILDLAFNYIAVAGSISDDGEWKIEHSLNPELVGCNLVGSLNDDSLCTSSVDYDGDGVVGSIVNQKLIGSSGTRQWKVMELSGCTIPS